MERFRKILPGEALELKWIIQNFGAAFKGVVYFATLIPHVAQTTSSTETDL